MNSPDPVLLLLLALSVSVSVSPVVVGSPLEDSDELDVGSVSVVLGDDVLAVVLGDDVLGVPVLVPSVLVPVSLPPPSSDGHPVIVKRKRPMKVVARTRGSYHRAACRGTGASDAQSPRRDSRAFFVQRSSRSVRQEWP